MDPDLQPSSQALAAFCRKHHIHRLDLFGSAARGELTPKSDVDVLVDFEPGHEPSLGEMVRMREELSDLFGGRSVDLATRAILRNPYRRRRILNDIETLYAA